MKTILSILFLALSINAYALKKHPKVIRETVVKKNMLDRKTHPNSEIIDFEFADGITAHMVKKGDTWYNYNNRGEEKEKAFESKEAGLQKIWSAAVATEALGAAAASTKMKGGKSEKGVLRDKNGAYTMKNGKKSYISKSNKSKFFSH
jgi:hypothetical protein